MWLAAAIHDFALWVRAGDPKPRKPITESTSWL